MSLITRRKVSNGKVIAFVVVFFLVFSLFPLADSYATCKKKGETAPEFTLSDINGNIVKLSDFKGKIVFVTFWATWCAKCWEEIDFIRSSLEKRDDLVILLVNMETRTLSQAHLDKIKTTVEKLKITYPVLLDLKLKVYQEYCVSSLPSTLVIDKQGVIQFAAPHFYQAYKEQINTVIKDIK